MTRTSVPTALVAYFSLVSIATAATTEHDVLGWTPNDDVVVAVVERGEQMVDGVSKDYYVEATQTFGAGGGTLYQHGEPRGPVPDAYARGLDAATGDALRNGLNPDVDSSVSPDGKHYFAWFSRERIDKPDEKTFVCKLLYRVVVLAKDQARVHTALDAEAAGETSRRQDEAKCPRLLVSPHWSPTGKSGLALVKVGGETAATFVNVNALDGLPHATFAPAPLLVAKLAPAEAAAWQALDRGEFDAAATAFEAAGSKGGAALAQALAGKKKATKAADAAQKGAKDPRAAILRAAAYVAAGEGKKVAKWIDDAVKKASSYDELLGFAAIFEQVDPNVATQLAVHALSHASAAQADTRDGWTLLARGLIDLGEYSKAQEALTKITEPTPASLALQALYHLDKRQENLAVRHAEELLFSNPGDCFAYHVHARIAAVSGANRAAWALAEAGLACDPGLEDAAFTAADFARLAGDAARARVGFEHFLRIAPPRGADQVRSLRRVIAERWRKRFGHAGVVLTDLSCRRGGAGYLCTGTLENMADAAASEVTIEALVKGKSVGSTTVPSIGPRATAPFGVSFAAKSLADVTITAGRDKKERQVNETPAQ